MRCFKYDLLKEIEEITDVPLVIHGSTGLPNKDLLMLKDYSIGKMNIGTALRMTFGKTMREYMNENPDVFDRLKVFVPAMEETKKVILDKYKRLGW